MSLQLLPLTPGRHADWLRFFEGPAFADNPAWASCYCAYNYLDHSTVKWSERGGDENRSCMGKWIAEGHAQGWLAYQDGIVVGWLNAAPRSHYPAFACHGDDDARTGVLSCFVIAPSARRQGIASTLLKAACNGFETHGFTTVEAWPNREARDAATHYHGPLDMYLANGFVVVRDEPNESLIQVRRTLA